MPFEPNKRVCLFFPKKEGFPAAFGFGLLGRGPPGDFIKIFYVISFTFFAPEFDKGPVFPGFGPCGARSFTKNPAYSTDFLAFLCYNKVNSTTRQEPLLFLVCSIPAAGLCRRKTARPHRRPGFPRFPSRPDGPGPRRLPHPKTAPWCLFPWPGPRQRALYIRPWRRKEGSSHDQTLSHSPGRH